MKTALIFASLILSLNATIMADENGIRKKIKPGAWARVEKAGEPCSELVPLLLFNYIRGKLVVIIYTGDHSLAHRSLVSNIRGNIIHLRYRNGKDDVLRIRLNSSNSFVVENQVLGYTESEKVPMPTWPPNSVFARCDNIDVERDFANIWEGIRK